MFLEVRKLLIPENVFEYNLTGLCLLHIVHPGLTHVIQLHSEINILLRACKMKLRLTSTTVALKFLNLISIFFKTLQTACQGDLILGVT